MSDHGQNDDNFLEGTIKPWHAVAGLVVTLGMLGVAKHIVDDHRTNLSAASAICHTFQQRARDGVTEGKAVAGELLITPKQTGVSGGFSYRCHAPVAHG